MNSRSDHKKVPLRGIGILVVGLTIGLLLPQQTQAQFVIADVIKLVVKKVINGIDIAVQQVQNKTIVLQNAEKALENAMAQTQLAGIADWVDQQRQLYADYYQELRQVKSVISGYSQIRKVVQQQSALVREYQAAIHLFRQDRHFTPAELDHMEQVYVGILQASLSNLQQLLSVTSEGSLQLDDADRLVLIDAAEGKIQRNHNDLHRFNQAAIQLSLHRSRDAGDQHTVRQLYGLHP